VEVLEENNEVNSIKKIIETTKKPETSFQYDLWGKNEKGTKIPKITKFLQICKTGRIQLCVDA
jgi:hypothetical protein